MRWCRDSPRLGRYMGVELHVHGLPSWMKKMNPNKMTAKDKSNIVGAPLRRQRSAEHRCTRVRTASPQGPRAARMSTKTLADFANTLQLKMTHKMSAKARKSCMETEKNGARCIF